MQGPCIEKIDASKYDIINIDSIIRKKLRNTDGKIFSLREELDTAKWIAQNGLEVDKKYAIEKIQNIKKRIEVLENGFEFLLYIAETETLIEDYKKLSVKSVDTSNSFIRKKSANVNDANSINIIVEKKRIIQTYIQCARKYCDIENINIKNVVMCNGCFSTEFEDTHEANILICKNCGAERSQLDNGPNYKDIERIKLGTNGEYVPDVHFINAMNKFECKQTTKLPATLVPTIIKDLNAQNIPIEKATKKQIYELIQSNKYSKYYSDINLIHYKVTNNKPYDISHIRNELLDMHKQWLETSVQDDFSSNEINVNFKLFNFLLILDFDCSREDFFFLKDPEKEREVYQKYTDKIRELQNKYPNDVTSNGKKRWRIISYF